MIRVSHLVYEYPGKRALDDVSFEIKPGSITALVGPNGAGKTTLLRCIAALDEPFSGHIDVAGINASLQPRAVHQAIGYLSDFFGVYSNLSVRQCLIFAARLHQLPESDVFERVQWVAKLLEMEPYLNAKASTLSRGWRQRLGIAQAIIHKPRLLMLDEPASGLDPEARFALSGLFKQLQAGGMTLLVSSHILSELEDYCTEMLVLRDGKIMEHRPAVASAEEALAARVTFLGSADPITAYLKTLASVSGIAVEGSEIRFAFKGGEEEQHQLLKGLLEKGAKITGFVAQKTRLQDIYLALAPEKKAH